MSAFRVKLSTNDLNCVDVHLNPTHSRLSVCGRYSGHVNSEFRVESVISSSDRHILSGSEDGCVYVWHLVDVSCILAVSLACAFDMMLFREKILMRAERPMLIMQIFAEVKIPTLLLQFLTLFVAQQKGHPACKKFCHNSYWFTMTAWWQQEHCYYHRREAPFSGKSGSRDQAVLLFYRTQSIRI